MKAALALLVLSLILIGASVPMAPFKLGENGSLPMQSVPYENSEAYFVAWSQAVTTKFKLQDYGVTLLAYALSLAAFCWRPFKAPPSRLGFVILAAAAPFLTVFGYIFDLMQAQARMEFPPWGDSLGIPLMGIPVILFAGLLWAFAHFSLLAGIPQRAGLALSLSAIHRSHPWLLIVSTLTAILSAIAAAEGAYWYVIPGSIWLYYYAAIAAVRQMKNDG
jgi:hypothetical protein